jgi:hypothetical protein
VVKIQGKAVKKGKRNALFRFVLSKTDKDKIAGWKQDFIRVLHVFNVRSIGFVGTQTRTQQPRLRPSWQSTPTRRLQIPKRWLRICIETC